MSPSEPKNTANYGVPKWVWGVYVLAILIVSARNLMLPWGDLFSDGGFYSHYNNYIIFKQSFCHLIAQKDLYVHYPQEQYDLFKYPPTFALLFAPFSVLPDVLGYPLWTAINLLLPVVAIHQLQGLSQRGKALFSIILLFESVTSALNSQSNGLMLGLLMLAFVALQQQSYNKAILFIWLTAFIKLFGLLFFALILVFPTAMKKSLWRIPVIFGLLFILPWPMLGWEGLVAQYESMFNLLAHDHGFFVKYSVMGWLKQWFAFQPDKNLVLLFGLIMQLMPLLVFSVRFNLWQSNSLAQLNPLMLSKFRFLYAGSWLIWMVIFNHMAESATYVIAVGGALLILTSLYFAESSPDTTENKLGLRQMMNSQTSKIWILGFVLLILFTVLGPTDIYPKPLRLWIVEQAQLKAFPCILIWVSSTVELLKTIRLERS
jgi:hypothetical protein